MKMNIFKTYSLILVQIFVTLVMINAQNDIESDSFCQKSQDASMCSDTKKTKMASKIACVLGGTGETGKRVIDELRKLDVISRIDMLNRREVELSEGLEAIQDLNFKIGH
jgi:hypothetical protein